ncbi:septum formation inhibitor Maf [uncultured Dokdonia sp.]|uniref:septum formation inhibitor Maf n=1 Tax=uncultured Dokdonia sp. TaxID=575653 RepID=UPI002618DFE0|nr:septum formation inhibitor Maf [uncultured Dokdonia sp.]
MSFPEKLFKLDRTLFFLMIAMALIALLANCKGDPTTTETAEMSTANSTLEVTKNRTISQEFKDYWYAGKAEISSYKLEQARYGEMRDGTAVLIYVTEDFLPEIQVKADRQNERNIPVLKINATKNFNTGIYPYSVMTSTFYPVFEEKHAIKVSQSMQEWCGHQYAQINNRDQFEVSSHSYFEGEADQKFTLPKDVLENELWTQLRIDPTALPTGKFNAIPDFSYTRMKHIPLKAYEAKGTLTASSYTLEYPELKRTLNIQFSEAFPYIIESWEDTYVDGYGANGKALTTKATRIKTIKSAYWSKNSNADAGLRTDLGLE